MLIETFGRWQIADNVCTAILTVDRPRSISISFEWSREPGPTENEHLNIILPDIAASALEVLDECAALSRATLDLIADGKLCRIGIKDGLFLYALTDQAQPPDRLGKDDV
jgi:hypothetical protein